MRARILQTRLNSSLGEPLSIHSQYLQKLRQEGSWALSLSCVCRKGHWSLPKEHSLGFCACERIRHIWYLQRVSDLISFISHCSQISYTHKTLAMRDSWKWYLDRTVVIEPGKERGRIPVWLWSIPVSIRPDQIRFVSNREMSVISQWLISSSHKGTLFFWRWSVASLPLPTAAITRFMLHTKN